MKLLLSILLVSFALFVPRAIAQVPVNVGIQILKAEDARRYDATLEELMLSPNADIRARVALAAGRIGNDAAISPLAALLQNDPSEKVRAMATFAIGEIESIKGAEQILKTLRSVPTPDLVRSRSVEAAGKIAAANPKDPRTKDLATAILAVLNTEYTRAKIQDTPTVLLALTAVLRARPDEAETVVANFLTNYDARVRADAANTLTRLKAKNANDRLRTMVAKDTDPVARANAARALGAAEDKDALDLLVNAANTDADSRVRVSAIRSLAALKDVKAGEKLLDRANKLLGDFKKPNAKRTAEKNELIEIAVTLGRLFQDTQDKRVATFLNEFRLADGFSSPEVEVALARVDAEFYLTVSPPPENFAYWDPKITSAYAQGISEIGKNKDEEITMAAAKELSTFINGMTDGVQTRRRAEMLKAMPDLTRALVALKPGNLNELLRGQLANDDVFIRAAAAELMAEQPRDKENLEALKKAFDRSLLTDKHDNDAQLAILDALFKLDKKESVGTLLIALSAQDYIVRKKVFELLGDADLQKDFRGVPTSLENARARHKDQVLPYSPAFGTKLGQVLNTDADYRRAGQRKNGAVKAVLTTEKGTFTIDLMPEDAPLTVDNFIKLANARYFNGLEVHRVVPNFVMQDGDPRGDGNGGPGWSIRCEINMLQYDRGAVGMALSGKDTGGSQWFVTHSPQPHLDGGYTVFGRVNETDMKVVDNIVRGDKIISVKVIGR